MAIYFISDAHLGEGSGENENVKLARLESFFELAGKDAEKLFILGDLFDFWFEYKHAIPKQHLKIIFRLSQLVDKGVEVHYITGNHDFWLGDFLSREAGIIIHRDAYATTEQEKKLFLIHGDGISPSDKGYRVLKKILRNRLNIWLYRKIPVDWGIPLAKFVSGTSRDYTSARDVTYIKDYEIYAQKKIKEGFDVVMIGHLHHPVITALEGGIYINTGDFIKHFSYVILNDGKFSLEFIR